VSVPTLAPEPRVGWSVHAKAVWRTRWVLATPGAIVAVAEPWAAPVDLVVVDRHGVELVAVHVGETVPKRLAQALSEMPAPVGTRRSVVLWRDPRGKPIHREIGTSPAALALPSTSTLPTPRPALMGRRS
jgi:hypothetical protein